MPVSYFGQCTMVMWDVIIERTWMKDMQKFSMLFLQFLVILQLNKKLKNTQTQNIDLLLTYALLILIYKLQPITYNNRF